MRPIRNVVLDAMGVIYESCDDVQELLIPFLRENNCSANVELIQELYRKCSLGHFSSTDFWRGVGIELNMDDEYLKHHKVSEGLIEFLNTINKIGIQVDCISNDVSEWSKKLRAEFNLEGKFHHWIISGDVGARKPDIKIYQHYLSKIDCSPHECLFIDDRLANIKAASETGMQVILLSKDNNYTKFTSLNSFKEIEEWIMR